MSDPSDRRKANRAWHPDRTMEMLGLIERFRHYERIVASYPDPVGELARIKADFWVAARGALDCLPVQRGQQCGTRLGKRSALGGRRMQFYGRTSEIEAQRWGTKIRVALNCREASPALLRKAFEQVDRVQLRQMKNADLKAAGIVLSAEVTADGLVDLVGVVTDPVAMTKVSERTYTGCLVSFDGDVISDISLIDSPAAFMEKGSRLVGGPVICKIFVDGGGGVKAKKMAKLAAAQRQADAELAKQWREMSDAERFAVTYKASRQHAAVGDAALMKFLRHGRP